MPRTWTYITEPGGHARRRTRRDGPPHYYRSARRGVIHHAGCRLRAGALHCDSLSGLLDSEVVMAVKTREVQGTLCMTCFRSTVVV